MFDALKQTRSEQCDHVDTSNVTSGKFLIFKKIIIDARAKISRNLQTLKSIAALISSNMAATVLNVVGGFLVFRFIGPEEIGLFNSFTIPLTYIMFLHLGTFDGLWRQIPYYVGKEMPEKVDVLASAAGVWNIFISVVVSCGFICCAIYSLLHHDLYGVFGWLSQALCCWGVFYGGYLVSTYRTLHHFVALARIQMVQSISKFGMVFLLPFLGFYGLCMRAVFPSILEVLFYQRNRPLKIPYRFDAKALSELMKIGIPFSFWGSLNSSIWVASESALMLYFGGVIGLGLFSVGVAMRAAINALPMSVYQVLTPRVVNTFARDGSVRNANRSIRWLTVGLTGFMVIIACVVSYLLDILIPYAIPKYVDGIPIMKICLWFPVIQAACLPINTLFAADRSWLYGRGVIVGLVVFSLTTYLLIPVIGGSLAVIGGSLLGRTARTCAAYIDLIVLTKREV